MDTRLLDGFIGELLHINDVAENKLIDLGASGGKNTYFLSQVCIDQSAYALGIISERKGKPGNTILLNSALSQGTEQRVVKHINTFKWRDFNGGNDLKSLYAFMTNARKELNLRGNNPLFLSVGALRWRISVQVGGKETPRDILTPLLIFPVRLVAAASSSPVTIEFIDDDIYVNPCLFAKLERIYGEEIAGDFPMPPVSDAESATVDLDLLGDGVKYFTAVKEYVKSCTAASDTDTLFEFDKDVIAIAQYNHAELCTYYDIRRNRSKIVSHPLVEKLFSRTVPAEEKKQLNVIPKYILPYDSVQSDIITRVINGESMIIKGPPGTGKTFTIANMIAALLSENKRVLFASKKISALNEVYAKLPEKLRKFAMLLDSETESKAAKINPAEVKQDFKRLLSDSKSYKMPSSLEQDSSHAMSEKAKTLAEISAYANLMYGENCIAGDSFYAAMDAYCRNDAPVVRFADSALTPFVTREHYNTMYAAVRQASTYYSIMSSGGSHSVRLCPWLGINDSCDMDRAMSVCTEIGEVATSAASEVCTALAEYSVDWSKLTLRECVSAVKCTLPEQTVVDLLENHKAIVLVERLEKCLYSYFIASDKTDKEFTIERTDATEDRAKAINALCCDKKLTLSEIASIYKNKSVFYLDEKHVVSVEVFKNLAALSDEISNHSKSTNQALDNAQTVFKSDLNQEQANTILNFGKSLAAYDKHSVKPKLLDFKAKKAYETLCGLSYLKAPEFGEVVYATAEYLQAAEYQSKINQTIEAICRCFHRNLSESELTCLLLIAANCKPEHAGIYVENIVKERDFIVDCASEVDVEPEGEITVGELIDGYDAGYKLLLVKEELERINTLVCVWDKQGAVKAKDAAKALCLFKNFIVGWKKVGGTDESAPAALNALKNLSRQAVSAIGGILSGLTTFEKEFFKNYYTARRDECTFAEFEILAKQANDRDVIGAAASYGAIKQDKRNPLSLAQFFYPFEMGEVTLPEGLTFADVFEHSFFGLALECKNKALGVKRNGLGNHFENLLAKLSETEDKIFNYNVELIQARCLNRINPDDKDFIFVQDNNPGENLRLMFKRHSSGVLKLKKCMILSPYTASLLFRQEEFNDFDVLIVDEASQLEPALMLPVLFRSKQCVIVGDEWQMPPIKHFVQLSPVTGEEEEGYAALEPEISALGLALRYEGFPVRELICHYRSKTESLIKFSQKLFYPNMRTFPAPVPARLPQKGVCGLGFKDVYLPEGIVNKGVNEVEAQAVVEELRRHFEYYYDEESKTLSTSVGVVAFGESQCQAIIDRVNADKDLSGKIKKALENFDDLPEKLIFFKTIETVQGQEIAHLILSLTHGRRATGLHMSFGQLNQGKLGRCIFNVAVTRAQSMVTVVHSVRSQEITAESVSYIRDYLETVERFCTVGREQFVSEQTDKGFLSSVADYVCSQGVARERVVFNYGVTAGSVRLPIAVLSADLKEAQIGIWCETPVGGKYDFLDYNLRYKANLEKCGWKLHVVSIHDWVDNNQNEKKLLLNAIKDIIA